MNYQKFTRHVLDYFHIFHLFISCLLLSIKIFLDQLKFFLINLHWCFVLLLFCFAVSVSAAILLCARACARHVESVTADGDVDGGRSRELCD